MAKKLFSTLKKLVLFSCFTGGSMVMLNRWISRNANRKNLLKKGASYNYPWIHGDIYYTKIGNGPKNILLLHDAASHSSSYEWKQVAERLSDEYTVYALDLLGCGCSDKPAMTYTNFLYVQLIDSFIKDVIGGPAEIAAVGLSSSFAVMASAFNRENISKIYMVNPWSLKKLAAAPDYTSRLLGILMAVPVLGTSLYNAINCRSNLEYLLDEKSFYNPFKVRDRMIDAGYEAAHRDDGAGRYLLASLDGRYLNWNINKAVSQSRVPMTLIFGEKAPSADKIAKAYQKLNDQITVQSVENTKMYPHMEEPVDFAKLILNS